MIAGIFARQSALQYWWSSVLRGAGVLLVYARPNYGARQKRDHQTPQPRGPLYTSTTLLRCEVDHDQRSLFR